MSDFEITGFDELEKKLDEIAKQGQQKLNKFVRQEAELIKGDAAGNTPTDTGNLKKSWKRTNVVNGTCVIYNNTEYAPDVEYGHRVKSRKTGEWVRAADGNTKVVHGAHMLRDAYENAKRSLPEHAGEFLEDLLKK
ncbi:MAG: HK97 gp10 family phage protein [Acidaminococcaceae bacterium]|nr:HK97 gp10 family phage protein [Acidaminococcaceae bacterium]